MKPETFLILTLTEKGAWLSVMVWRENLLLLQGEAELFVKIIGRPAWIQTQD